MKTKNILLSIVALFIIFTWVSADYKVYDNLEDFESNKWNVCEAATDGCNNYFLINWKVAWWTLKFCQNHKVEWKCTKFKDNVKVTKSIISNTNEQEKPLICTMEYAPVCWVDWKTYSNKCMAGKVKIDYSGECSENLLWWDKDKHGCIWSAWYSWSQTKNKCIRVWEEQKLSKNDQNMYNAILKKLDNKYQVLIKKVTKNYTKKISKYSNIKKEQINKKLIDKIEQQITVMLLKYPQDKKLPQKINNVYLSLKLFKFELMNLDF